MGMRILLGAIGALCLLSQFVTMAKFAPMAVSVSYYSAARWWSTVRQSVDLNVVDATIAAAMPAVASTATCGLPRVACI